MRRGRERLLNEDHPPEEADTVETASAAPQPVDQRTALFAKKPRRWLFVLPVAVGIVAFAILNRNARSVRPAEVHEVARVLRVIEVTKLDVAPRALAYGTSTPGQIWQAVAEVSGRIAEAHPDLSSGAFVSKGTVLIKIDERDYELAIASSLASIEQIGAQLAELTAQEESTKASLRIEERSLQLAEANLRRQQTLQEQGLASSELVDAEERSVLTQRQSVQSLKTTLALIPSQRQSLEANQKSSKTQLSQAERDLSRATLRAPFDCRLGTVTLEEDQYLATGQLLFEAYSLKVTEVEARFSPSKLRTVFSQTDVDPAAIQPGIDMDAWRDLVKVSAKVRVSGLSDMKPWPARLDRIRESVDPETRTIGVVVAVDEPYKEVIPGRRPPLTKDLFCEVELKAAETVSAIVIPSSALAGRIVYTLNQANRIEKREVTLGFSQGTFVTIESGLAPGDRVIVSDPSPAIEGMLVDPLVDSELASRLRVEAGDDGALK